MNKIEELRKETTKRGLFLLHKPNEILEYILISQYDQSLKFLYFDIEDIITRFDNNSHAIWPAEENNFKKHRILHRIALEKKELEKSIIEVNTIKKKVQKI